MLFISFPIGTVSWREFQQGVTGSDKPKVMVALGDTPFPALPPVTTCRSDSAVRDDLWFRRGTATARRR